MRIRSHRFSEQHKQHYTIAYKARSAMNSDFQLALSEPSLSYDMEKVL